MSRLLYVESSPRKSRSSSIEVARVFLDAYSKSHPHDEIVVVDLWKKKLPPFDGDVIDAKYAITHGKPSTPAQKEAWKLVEEVIAEFKNADKYVISLPMWNYSIPYKLKHYIDVLVQPGYTFKVVDGEYEGLMKGKKMMLIYSRGGAYGSGTGAGALDLQKPYMETILQFIGFEHPASIIIEHTLASDDAKNKAVHEGKEQALKAAGSF
jgi:FMN-dependent NADH-azoreductase